MSNNDERQERIAQIRARVEAATPGPWVTWPDGTEESVEAVAVGRFVCHLNSNMRQFREDAALIANAPADLAYLLERVAALEVERDGLRGWQNGQTHYVGCWREHRQCALTTIDFEGARRERAELALREAVAELNRLREGQEP